MLERNHHTMIVGDSFRIPFRYRAESRVRRAVRNRIGASPSWERAEAPCVCVRVLNQFMNSMMAEVSDAERSTRVKCLCSCRLHRWYCGARVRFSAAVIPGGKKFGTVAWICASVCPDAKALMNAELEAAAFENKLPVSSGVRPSPVTVNEFTSGGLLKKFDAMLSTESWKTPIPPSRTVLCVTPKGCQAKLNRGDHRILSRPWNACF